MGSLILSNCHYGVRARLQTNSIFCLNILVSSTAQITLHCKNLQNNHIFQWKFVQLTPSSYGSWAAYACFSKTSGIYVARDRAKHNDWRNSMIIYTSETKENHILAQKYNDYCINNNKIENNHKYDHYFCKAVTSQYNTLTSITNNVSSSSI